MLNLGRSRKSLISVYCRYCGARSEITFALDIQSPRSVRTCHSGWLVLTPVDVRYCQNLQKFTWVSCHAEGFIGSGSFSASIVPFSATESFLILLPKSEISYRQGFDTLPRPSTKRNCCHMTSFCSGYLVETVGDITTIFRFFSRALTNSLAIAVVRSSQFSRF